MDKLPDLVKSALTAACNLGKALSWKVQETDKGTLIQLVWKLRLESSLVASESQAIHCKSNGMKFMPKEYGPHPNKFHTYGIS